MDRIVTRVSGQQQFSAREIMVNIFSYTDFSKYLLDLVADMQQQSSFFSQALIAHRFCMDPGNFSRVLKGERKFPPTALEKLGDTLKLKKRERSYLHALYSYCCAPNLAQKRQYFEEMLRFRESRIRHIESDKYEFYERWYYSAVREVLAYFKYDGTNADELGRHIVPSITAQQVERAIQTLTRLKLVRENAEGYWYRTDEVIDAGPVSRGLAINNYMLATLRLAKDALEQPSATVQFSSTNLTISKRVFNEIAEEIRLLRRKALEMARDCQDPDRVYQLNFQLFPLTKHENAGDVQS